MQKCLAYFPGVDRTVDGLRGADRRAGLPAEQRHARPLRRRLQLPRAASGRRSRPTRSSASYETDYRWLTQVYESVKPSTGTGKLLWHALGAEDDRADPRARPRRRDPRRPRDARARRRPARSRARHAGPGQEGQGDRDQGRRAACASTCDDPRFKALGERLEELKERHEQGLLDQRRVPEGAARPRPRRRRSREAPPSRWTTRTAARPR